LFTAADLLDVLRQRRLRKSLRPEVPGQMPPGWQAWLEAMPERVGAVTGVPPPQLIAVLVQRPLATPPRRVDELNRWQSFATLWRQQWQPPVREERGQRWFATGFSATLHVLFIVLLLWLGYVQLTAMPPATGDSVVQVEFIGQGTPEDAGGGEPSGAEQPQPTPEPPAPAAAQPQPATAQPQVEAQPPAEATPEVAEPQPAPVAAQPIQVTEVAVPDTAFTLPPPKPRTPNLQQPSITVPQLRTTLEDIIEQPRVAAPVRSVELPQRDIVVPEVRESVAEIEVPERLPQARALPQRTATPQLQVPALQNEPGELRVPTPASSTAAASSAAPQATPAATPGSATTAAGPVSPSTGTQPSATAAGSGTAPASKPGALPAPVRGDDWGAASRTRPGGAPAGRAGERPGLFGADGRPNLVDAPAPARNAPGTVEQSIADLDRAGTWLKRPPYDYKPTMFDRFWVPRETLLQEWVRKGIKKISIPIPGTSLKLECVVSALQLGAGCGLNNPDVNDQPARGRPPPDIPFKPHLQEDNGSVKPQP
jgi:hypothetical protein